MIIQCDHCSAKFKMDDSKLANGPVKVRCAKCKEVFVVQPEEPVAASVAPPLPAPAAPVPESSAPTEFSFDASADAHASASTDTDEFSFDVAAPPAEQSDSGNEFDWQDGAAPAAADAQTHSEFDLSSFNASLDTLNATAARTAVAEENNDFDFGEVDLTAQHAAPEETSVVAGSAAIDDFSIDFGEVSFADNTAETAARPDPFVKSPAENNDVNTDVPTPAAESAAADDFLRSFKLDAPQPESSAAAEKDAQKNANFSEFSFAVKEEPAIEAIIPAAVKFQEPPADEFVPPGFSAEALDEEELPPASLTSRKKSGSLFPLAVIFGAILLIVALVGSGIYFFGGPKAFSKVGLGFLVEWYGNKGAEEGSIALKGVSASYAVNSTAGEIFVVRGEAVNNFTKPRASIQIKVTLLGTGGAQLVTKSAYCGNSLSNEQLTTLPLAKIEEIMNNQFGDSLANLGLKPGGTIPFVVVVSPLPKEATDYAVAVGGSTVATQ